MKKRLIAIIFFSVLTLQMSSISQAGQELHYTYEVTQDKKNNDYLFSITFTDNITIYKGYIVLQEHNYTLQEGLTKNTYYSYLPTNPAQTAIELHLYTSDGPIIESVSQQTTEHINTQFMNNNDILALIFFIVLVVLIAKYVLFYEQIDKS